ncbi:MAG: tetratricopeptide repeat protein, partial [Xanthobacteraceae bacterium]
IITEPPALEKSYDRDMAFRIALAALLFLIVAGASLRAAEPAPIPLAVGLTESEAKERAALFAALAATKSDAEARAAEDRIWTFWRGFADEQSRQLLEQSKEAQLRFDYDEALLYLKELVKHAPQFAEGWNQLGYVYFLAGQYDASLKAIDEVLALEPMHYAALAGKGIILIQQGKVAEAQAPLKRALEIDPWLKERNLIGEDRIPEP